MFSLESNGYNKAEVDMYIQRIKASYEAKLMEEKLKALDSEKKALDLKNERFEIENKEKNIMTALNVIEKAKKFQEDGSKTFYKLLIEKLELLLKELNLKFPQLRNDQDLVDILKEFSNMIQNYKEKLDSATDMPYPVFSENDSMRVLLNKMQGYKKNQETPKEIHIATTQQKSVASLKDFPKSESGFSFEEALNPTEDLAEIMKAFDFYNE